jgi:hypothetical protein
MSDTQKRLITWRVDEGLLARIDARAKELGRSRSAFLVWAAENGLEDARGGVPDAPRAEATVQGSVHQRASVDGPKEWAMERQRRLNAAREGRR